MKLTIHKTNLMYLANYCTAIGICLLLLLPFDTRSQTAGFFSRKEKAVALLKDFSKQDTARVGALYHVVDQSAFLSEWPHTASYREEAISISRTLKFIPGIAKGYYYRALQAKSSSDQTLALQYLDTAIQLTENSTEISLREIGAKVNRYKGRILHDQDNFYEALHFYFEALKYYEQYNADITSLLYFNIAEIYNVLNNSDKAIEYAQKNLSVCLKGVNNKLLLYQAYTILADIYITKKDYPAADEYLEKTKTVILKEKPPLASFMYYLKKGDISFGRGLLPDALNYFQQANDIAEKNGHKFNKISSLKRLANISLELGNINTAKKYAQESLAIASESNEKSNKVDCYYALAACYHKAGAHSLAYDYLKKALNVKDSLISEKNIQQVNRLAAIYEFEKKQRQIAGLQIEKEKQEANIKRKSVLNIVFIGSITVLLVLGYLGYLNMRKGKQLHRQQQQIQQQKIHDLEKDKQLLTIDAMLKGQEEERSRIAKELHDGLGGLLSGTKLSFMNMRENLVLSAGNAQLFEQSLNMLDQTIADLRKVAQNLMPEALVKFGLSDAVKDFCHTIQQVSGIEVVFQFLGETRKHSNTAEVFIYRMIQELVNNAVKHAEATQIIVQLSINTHTTEITVEDNGKGFHKRKLTETRGAGMANIQYRVQYFNGTTDIATSPGNGTSIHIMLKT